MAKKLNSEHASSRAWHRRVRTELKKKKLCLWHCGEKQAKKPGGGTYILCEGCRKLAAKRRKAA